MTIREEIKNIVHRSAMGQMFSDEATDKILSVVVKHLERHLNASENKQPKARKGSNREV